MKILLSYFTLLLFWQTAVSKSTLEDGEVENCKPRWPTKGLFTGESLRRHLKLEDADGISSLPNSEIFEQLALMGVHQNECRKEKDKRKAIMKEDESVQKKTQKQLEQERLGHEEAIRLQEQINEEERQRIARDAKIAKYNPAVLKYHAVQNRSFSKAEVRKNMCIYLKNQGGYKQSHFKGMKYEDIRPIFERVWDQNQSFVPMDSELEVQRLKRAGQDVVEEHAKRQRTGEASGSVQEQTCEEPKAKELS
ncbi:hypothetical protein Tco_0369368 [Tanacetum coccineum]